MSDDDAGQPVRIDAGRPRGGLFDRDEGYSGQEYNRADAERQRDEDPPGTVDPDATEPDGTGADYASDPVAGSDGGDHVAAPGQAGEPG